MLKKYQNNKIHLLNYFTNIGKLKALYKIFGVPNKNIESLNDVFNSQIKKLRIKLENIDIEMINLLESQKSKQHI